jgi:hypothetical protein
MNTNHYFSDNCLTDHIEDSADALEVVVTTSKDSLRSLAFAIGGTKDDMRGVDLCVAIDLFSVIAACEAVLTSGVLNEGSVAEAYGCVSKAHRGVIGERDEDDAIAKEKKVVLEMAKDVLNGDE